MNSEIVIQHPPQSILSSPIFSPDGSLIAMVQVMGPILLYNSKGQLLYNIEISNQGVDKLVWHNSSDSFYISQPDGTILHMNLNGDILSKNSVGCYILDFDINCIDKQIVCLYSIESKFVLRCIDEEGVLVQEDLNLNENVHTCAFIANGNIIVIYESSFEEYNKSGDQVAKYSIEGYINKSHVTKNQILLSCNDGVYLKHHDDTELKKILKTDIPVSFTSANPDGTAISVGLINGNFLIADYNGNIHYSENFPGDSIGAVVWSPAANIILCFTLNGIFRCLNSEGSIQWEMNFQYPSISAFAQNSEKGLEFFYNREQLYNFLDIAEEVKKVLIKHATILPVGSIYSIDIAPNGLFAAGVNDSIIVWNNVGDKIAELKLQDNHVSVFSFDKSGERIAAGYPDGTVIIWSLDEQPINQFNTGFPIEKIKWDRETNIIALSYNKMSEDCKYTSTVEMLSPNGEVYLEKTLNDIVHNLTFNTSGVCVISMDDCVYLINSDGSLNEMLCDPDGHQIVSINFSNNDILYTGDFTGKIRIWKKQKLIRTINPQNDDGTSLFLIARYDDNHFLAAYSIAEENMNNFKNCIIMRTNEGELIFTRDIQGFTADIPIVVDRENEIIYCAAVNIVYRYDTNGIPMEPFRVATPRISAMDCRQGPGISLVTGYEDGNMEIWDSSGDMVTTANHGLKSINFIKLSPCGEFFAAAFQNGTISLLDIDCNKISDDIECSAVCIAIPNSSDRIALGKTDGDVDIISKTGEHIYTITGSSEVTPQNTPVTIVWNPDGSFMLIGYSSGEIKQFDSDGNTINIWQNFNIYLPLLAYNHSGHRVIYYTNSKLCIHDSLSGDLCAIVIFFQNEYTVYTPDGRYDVSDESLLEKVMFKINMKLHPSDEFPDKRVHGLLAEVLK